MRTAQTAQLLYDYSLRMANYTQAFMLSALMTRMTHALQINLEYTTELLGQFSDSTSTLSTTARESRRRLMWSCYITDAHCGSGVDQLMLLDDKDLKIQLPCDEQSFLHERPCITRMLNGSPLPFIPAQLISQNSINNTSLAAYFIQHIETRKRVLKYIKHLGEASLPWLPDSEYALFNNELQTWHSSLPAEFQFTSSSIYIHKESNQLGALTLLHCAYHQTMCDLYRLGAPALYKLRSAFYFPPEQVQFLRHLQWSLFKAARSIAAIIAEAGRHGPAMIADTWLPSITYDSNRIMLYYLTIIFDPADRGTKDLVLNTIPYLQSNVQALKMMRATNAVAEGMVYDPLRAASTFRSLFANSKTSTVHRSPCLKNLGLPPTTSLLSRMSSFTIRISPISVLVETVPQAPLPKRPPITSLTRSRYFAWPAATFRKGMLQRTPTLH